MLLFYEVLTRAGERLTISYPALDEKAQSSLAESLRHRSRAGDSCRRVVTHHARDAARAAAGRARRRWVPRDWRVQAMHDAIRRDGNLALLAGLFRRAEHETASPIRSKPRSASTPRAAAAMRSAPPRDCLRATPSARGSPAASAASISGARASGSATRSARSSFS